MKILHTSDWHLGRSLYDRKRYDEFSKFLGWLLSFIGKEKIDILLVAGDIFDSTLPSNRSQELYYQFLTGLLKTSCRHVVITGGNHDSPTLLNAPGDLLKALNIHVIGSATEDIRDEVITLSDPSGKPEAIVCAVPYLHDRAIRTVEPGESIDDKARKLIEGITRHYEEVGRLAMAEKERCGNIPVIGMGHLFTSGGRTADGDGVRELYVGTLAHVGPGIFPDCFDYVALGHLHLSQTVGDSQKIRFSGSPIPMGFAEAGQSKKVVIAEFGNKGLEVTEHDIPCFHELVRISGNDEEVGTRIGQLRDQGSTAWLEVDYSGNLSTTGLNELLDRLVDGSGMEIRSRKNRRLAEQALVGTTDLETLDSLDTRDVFIRCLDANEKQGEEREILIQAYDEIFRSLNEDDRNAE
jgi:exonuclease SbcD